jgi:hypothetical protein
MGGVNVSVNVGDLIQRMGNLFSGNGFAAGSNQEPVYDESGNVVGYRRGGRRGGSSAPGCGEGAGGGRSGSGSCGGGRSGGSRASGGASGETNNPSLAQYRLTGAQFNQTKTALYRMKAMNDLYEKNVHPSAVPEIDANFRSDYTQWYNNQKSSLQRGLDMASGNPYVARMMALRQNMAATGKNAPTAAEYDYTMNGVAAQYALGWIPNETMKWFPNPVQQEIRGRMDMLKVNSRALKQIYPQLPDDALAYGAAMGDKKSKEYIDRFADAWKQEQIDKRQQAAFSQQDKMASQMGPKQLEQLRQQYSNEMMVNDPSTPAYDNAQRNVQQIDAMLQKYYKGMPGATTQAAPSPGVQQFGLPQNMGLQGQQQGQQGSMMGGGGNIPWTQAASMLPSALQAALPGAGPSAEQETPPAMQLEPPGGTTGTDDGGSTGPDEEGLTSWDINMFDNMSQAINGGMPIHK